MDVDYQYIEQPKPGVAWRFDVAELPDEKTQLMFYATNIRRYRDGVKANIRIGYPGDAAPVADDFEINRDERRSKLTNQAAMHLWGVKFNDLKAISLAQKMLHFCEGLYDFWMGSESGDWVEGDAKPSAPRWLVPGLALEGAVAIWYGNRGDNKSTLARLVAQSLAHNTTSVIPIRKAGAVIWVNAEEPPEEHKRQLGNINAALGIDRTSPLFTIDARGMVMADLAPRLASAVEQVAPDAIFIDSLSRLAQGMNLNENATATMLIDSVAGLGPSINFIGHTGQENTHRMAGSRHFENAARLLVRVQSRMSIGGVSPELTRGLRATVRKANGAIETEPMFWTLKYHRQHGLMSAAKAGADEWPLLQCEAFVGEGKECRRKTWDGVEPTGMVRCSRHQNEDD